MAIVSEFNPASFSLFEKMSHQLDILKDAWTKRAVYRATYAELSALSNRELADLGLTRCGLKAIAYEAAYSA